MNIQQAVRSGKKIRRKAWVLPDFHVINVFNGIDREDVLADDWEVEEVAIPITAGQYQKAYEDAIAACRMYVPNVYHMVILDVGRRLGLYEVE